MTASFLQGDLYIVGTDHKVGTWDGMGVHSPGRLGGWDILQLTFDADGAMWCVGTAHNVGKWNGQGWDDKGKMGGWTIQQIVFDRDGTLWAVSTDHSVGKWNGHGFDDHGYPGRWHIQQLLFDRDGTMWCVGTDHNVGKWNGKSWDDKGHLGGWQIQQILFDTDGVMWCVGTEHNVGKWNGSGWTNLQSTLSNVAWIVWRPLETAAGSDNWTTPIAGANLASCLAYGMVWQGGGRMLYGFDHFTGKQTYEIGRFGPAANARAVQPYDDGLLVYASDGALYMVSLEARAKPTRMAHLEVEPWWMQAYRGSVYLASQGNGLQRVPPSSENFQPGSSGWISLPYGEGSVVGAPSFGDGYLLVPMRTSQVDAVDAITLKHLWSATVPWSGGYLTNVLPEKQTAFNGEYFCVASGAQEISVVSVSRRKVAWTKTFSADLSAQPVCDSNHCCVSLKTGQLLVLSVADGKLVKTISLQGIYDRLIMENGILHGVLDQYGYGGILPIDIANSVFAIDIAADTVAAAKTTSRAALIAVENGVSYYHTTDTVSASRVGKLVRTFYAEATLLQDFDFGGASASPKKPMINTEVTLFKEDGTPQPRQHVRVGATAPATIESGGETYSIGPSAYASIPTDASGRLRITMRPGEADENNEFRDGLTSPALTLFTTFMGSNHRILVRPDAQLHDKLARMETGTLASAADYDGKPILSAEYQGKDKEEAVGSATQMITATLSMVKTSVNQRNRRRATRDDYLAPGCDTEVICCCRHDDYAAPMVCTSNFAFDLDQATFKGELDEHETQQWLDAFQATGPVTRGLGDWLLKAIRNGTAAIKAAVVYAGQVASEVRARVKAAIGGGPAKIYDLVLETIEQAVTVVHGVFNEVVGAIDKVLQAFSFAFSWPRILTLKDQIKANMTGSWESILKGDPSPYDRAATATLTTIGTFRATADQAFEQIKANFGGKSVAGERKQAIGSENPAAGGSTGNWLQAKLSDNLLSQRALQQASGQTRSATMPIAIPDFVMPAGVIDELQGLVPRLGRLVTKDAELLFQRLAGDFTPGSGIDVFSATISAIIDIIREAVDIAIDLAREALATLFGIVKIVLKAVLEFVNKEIQIPFISDLYRSVVKAPLTLLDLSALLIAVPSSLVIAALTHKDRHAELTPRDLAGLSPRDGLQVAAGIIAGVAQVLWAVISAGLEFFNLVVEQKAATVWVKKHATRLNVFLLVLALFAVRGAFFGSEVLEATDHDTGEIDWDRVAKLWLPSTLAAAIDVVAALAKAWVLNRSGDTTDHETLLESVAWLSAGGDFICGFADFILASTTLATETGAKGQNWDYIAHVSEDLSLILRPFILLASKLPAAVYAQSGLIALSSACLGASGILKIIASSPAVHERSATA